MMKYECRMKKQNGNGLALALFHHSSFCLHTFPVVAAPQS